MNFICITFARYFTKRKPCWLKTSWIQTVMADLSDIKFTWGQAQHAGQNRDKLRGIDVELCPARDEEC